METKSISAYIHAYTKQYFHTANNKIDKLLNGLLACMLSARCCHAK